MSNNQEASPAVTLPSTEALNKRKEVIQTMYQAQDGVDYPLVSDTSLLNNLSIEELAKSYVALWSQYNKDSAKGKFEIFQLNCRLYDLCCRANVLNASYLKYLNCPPKKISKLPFHAWIYHKASSVVDGLPGPAHTGKKSILKSFPVNETNRTRALDLVSAYGLGLLASEESLVLGTLEDITSSDFTKLETSLNAVKDDLISAFKTTNIDDAFDSTGAKELANSGASKATPSNGA